MSILLAVLVCICTGAYIISPLLRLPWSTESMRGRGHADEDMDELGNTRDRLLHQIKDLEFDFRMGKVEPEDYQSLRQQLTQAAADVLRKIEVGQRTATPPVRSRRRQRKGADVDAALASAQAEAEILIAGARSRDSGRRQDELNPREAEPSAIRDWTCPSCSRKMGAQDRFCASCATARPE